MSIFQKTIQPKIDFSTFPLNRSSLISADFGELVPCFVQEVVPNDRFKVRGASTIQFAPMVAPMMQDVYVSYHYFYIPDRILYRDFESAFTGTRDGRTLTEEEIPDLPGWYGVSIGNNVSLGNINGQNRYFKPASLLSKTAIGTLSDFLEFPTTLNSANDGDTIVQYFDFASDLPFRAYFKIWYDWYRDENLQYKNFALDFFDDYFHAWQTLFELADGNTKDRALAYCLIDVDKFDGKIKYPLHLKYRSYRKDYFTACLPSPQKGEPVTISIGSTAPFNIEGSSFKLENLTGLQVEPTTTGALEVDVNNSSQSFLNVDGTPITALSGTVSGINGTVNLEETTAITINELRTAFALQRVLEAMSVSGSRYNEYLLSQYGTAPEDLRLQRPQFLGGWTQSVAVQQVIQTGGDQTGADANFMNQPGYAAGRMYSAGGDYIFSQTFKEPGYIIGLMSVMPKAGYFQGLPKHLTRKHRFDYYNPHFAYLGEQAVKNQELYFTGTVSDEGTFGYMQRWAEYRTSYDTIHGDFKSSLKYMHMYREFNGVPVLGEDFILTKDVDTRPFVLWKEQTNVNKLIWAQVYHQVESSRPMPYNPMPGIHG